MNNRCCCMACAWGRVFPVWFWGLYFGFSLAGLLSAWTQWLPFERWNMIPGGIIAAVMGLDAHTGWFSAANRITRHDDERAP